MFWGYIKRITLLSTYHYLVQGASMEIPRRWDFRKSKFSRASMKYPKWLGVFRGLQPPPSQPLPPPKKRKVSRGVV